jgi:signal transduction histidine kinase
MERRVPLPPRSDVLLAAAALAFAGLELWLNTAIAPRWASVPIESGAAVALAWRRRFPLATTAFVSSAAALEIIAGVPIQQPILPLLAIVIAVYSLVAHAPLDRVFAGLAVVGVALAVAVTSQREGLDNFAFGAMWVAGAALVGRIVRARIEEARRLEARAQHLEREREEQVRRAAAEERRRIARELHDVIAHSLSVMVVQAGAAEEMLRRDAPRALEPLRSVQDTGRKALAEMSRLLGVLREHGDEIALAPQPGLGELSSLVDETQAAGLPVELSVEGERRPLPLGVELSAYRIVQEALTNARKHATNGRARVVVRYAEDALEVEVVDNGVVRDDGEGGGFGLVGMRERVTVFGGSLEAGPRPTGGFGVRARLPLRGGT